MNEIHHSSHQHQERNPNSVHQGRHPYWKHAHRDWRFWVAVVFIFAAIFVYVMSDDLALVPHSHQQQKRTSTESHAQ